MPTHRRLVVIFVLSLFTSLALVAGFPMEAWPQAPFDGGLTTESVATIPPLPAYTLSPEPSELASRLSSPTATQAAPASPTALPSPTATPTPLPTPRGIGPESFPPGVNPLTGLRVPDPSLLKRRPMAIKITHFPRAVRPQWGLSLADVVYEYYIEDGLTRFTAVFYGNDASRAGPVRSGRYFDEHIFRMYRAIFVFANADQQVEDHLLETEYLNYFVVERRDNCPPLCRDRTNRVYNAYNNLLADTAGLNDYIGLDRRVDLSRPDLPGMYFNAWPPAGGVPAASLDIHYSTQAYLRWEYDPASRRYLRWQETADWEDGQGSLAPLIDSLTGSRIAADNVVLLQMEHQTIKEQPEIIAMDFVGTGRAIVLRDGQIHVAAWVRSDIDAPLRLQTPSGDPFPLKPGTTYYQVLGLSSTASQLGSAWRFDFLMP